MIKYSDKLPFWTKENENKITLEGLKDFTNKMKEDNTLKLNWINEFRVSLILDNNPNILNNQTIKYIYVNNKHYNEYYYYFVELKTIANNKYIAYFDIDLYATFTIKFLYANLDTKFIFLRKHNFTQDCLEMADEDLDNIPKFYKNIIFQKQLYNYDEENKIWYGDNGLGIKGEDLVNANRYYVFKNGLNGGYRFYPVMSKNLDIDLFYQEFYDIVKEYEGEYWNGRFLNKGKAEEKVEISGEVNNKVVEAYNNNKQVEYFYRPCGWRYEFPAHTIFLKDWQLVKNVPYGTLPVDIKIETGYENYMGEGLGEIDAKGFCLGNEFFSHRHWNITSSKQEISKDRAREMRKLKVIVSNRKVRYTKKQVKNSQSGLEILRRNEKYINLFLGVFYMPNFLNFKQFNIDEIDNGEYVYLSINPLEGEVINVPVYEYTMSNINNKYMNTSYSNPYLLKYLDIRYFGNKINAEFRVNDMFKIYLMGRLFFTDSAAIVSKNNSLLGLGESIITYPYQLPLGVSEYEQYLKANRGVVETGYSIAKREQDFSIAKGLTNGAFGVISGAVKSAAGFMGMANGGNTQGAAFGGIVEAAKAVSDTAFNMVEGINKMEFMRQKNIAQFQKAKMTMGNTINFSSIENAALIHYYNDNSGEQYEGVEIKELKESTLALLNNYLMLYGYFNPCIDTLKERLNFIDRDFTFLEFESLTINELINIDNNSVNANFIYDLVKKQLETGIRIWNKNIDNDIPNFDNNEVVKPERPGVNPPAPPVESTYILDIDINKKLSRYPDWNYFINFLFYGYENETQINYQVQYGYQYMEDMDVEIFTQFSYPIINNEMAIFNVNFNGFIIKNINNDTMYLFRGEAVWDLLKTKLRKLIIKCVNIPEELRQIFKENWFLVETNFSKINIEVWNEGVKVFEYVPKTKAKKR